MNVTAFMDVTDRFPDEERWELLDGEPVMMSPQSKRHQRIVDGLLNVCRRLTDGTDCAGMPGLGILSAAVDSYAPIPDVVVRCGKPVVGGYADDPILVAEVPSPSTMNWDRGGKLKFYQSVASLQVILIVYQEEIRVEAWLRDGATWRAEVRQGSAAKLALPSFGHEISLDDIYAKAGVPL